MCVASRLTRLAIGSNWSAPMNLTAIPSSFSMPDIAEYGAQLYSALRELRTIAPLISGDPDLGIDDAYKISLDLLARRRRDGEKVVGKKIGVTSKAVQDMLGVFKPDFGFLTDAM